MVHIALQIDQGGFLLQDSVVMSFGNSIHEGLLILVAFADEHIIADTDDIRHEAYHVGCFTNGLSVSNLGLLFIQVLNLQSQQIAGAGKGEAGSGGVIAEDRNSESGVKDLC